MIRGVLFDMDGLLFDTEREAIRLSKEAASALGWEVPDEIFIECVGLTDEGCRRVIVDRLGPDYPFERVYEAWGRGLSELAVSGRLPQKAGAHRLVTELKSRGIPLALATSSPKAMAEANLASAGWMEHFEVVVSGDQVSKGKPDPEVFLTAAARLGLAPGECLVFEDSMPGIRAAHAAGCRPVMVPDLKQPDREIRELVHSVVSSLDEAAEKWDELSS